VWVCEWVRIGDHTTPLPTTPHPSSIHPPPIIQYGYASVAELAAVAANYSAAAIPLDVLWGDIDYMSGWRDFTFDEAAWPEKGVRALVDRLHADGRRFVPILDPGIKLEPGYAPYDDGVAAGVFVRDVTGAPYIGEVWPGAVHFVDFMHPRALDYWHKHVAEFHAKVPFDGEFGEGGGVCENTGSGRPPFFFFNPPPPPSPLLQASGST
jgi:Glycosyl hydrolases family 31